MSSKIFHELHAPDPAIREAAAEACVAFASPPGVALSANSQVQSVPFLVLEAVLPLRLSLDKTDGDQPNRPPTLSGPHCARAVKLDDLLFNGAEAASRRRWRSVVR